MLLEPQNFAISKPLLIFLSPWERHEVLRSVACDLSAGLHKSVFTVNFSLSYAVDVAMCEALTSKNATSVSYRMSRETPRNFLADLAVFVSPRCTSCLPRSLFHLFY